MMDAGLLGLSTLAVDIINDNLIENVTDNMG